jgi:hypothetical protein
MESLIFWWAARFEDAGIAAASVDFPQAIEVCCGRV